MNIDRKVIAGAVGAVIALSAAGLGFIANNEGKENAPYQDIAGIWTVCYGSTGAHVVSGGTRTDEECLTLLESDAERFVAAVNRCTPAPKNQNQFDALVSLSFNIGEQSYCNSTLARKFNSGDTQGAADQFLVWNKARVNGVLVTVKGLDNRRRAERTLFLKPVEEAPVAAPSGSANNCPGPVVEGPARAGNQG